MPSAARWSASAHPGHGHFPGVVHGLGEDLQLLVLAPAAGLQADVVDGGADDEAERLEAGLAKQHVFRHRQVGGEHARRISAGRLREPAVGRLRLPHRRTLVLLLVSEQRHGPPPIFAGDYASR
jgi:hypothetical protein